MESYCFCQSCGMPLDHPELWGTEKDHSKSTIYCVYCYRDGAFTNEGVTLDEMKIRVRDELVKVGASERVIDAAVARLPHLTRWLCVHAIHHNCEWH